MNLQQIQDILRKNGVEVKDHGKIEEILKAAGFNPEHISEHNLVKSKHLFNGVNENKGLATVDVPSKDSTKGKSPQELFEGLVRATAEKQKAVENTVIAALRNVQASIYTPYLKELGLELGGTLEEQALRLEAEINRQHAELEAQQIPEVFTRYAG